MSPLVARAGEATAGTRGAADQRAVVNIADIARQQAAAPASRQAVTPKAPPHHPRTALTGTAAAARALTQPSQEAIVASRATTTSPAPSASFMALGDDNSAIPPDTQGALGPNHMMETLNTQVRISTRTGSPLSTVSLDSFWASLNNPNTPNTFDPRIEYDPFSNRWIFVTLCNPDSNSSSILIGVTQTSDPTGSWNLYRIKADPNNQFSCDYPNVGFNKDWIMVTVNMFALNNGNFARADVYAFDKADLYANGTGLFTRFQDPNGSSITAALTYDNTLGTAYLVDDASGPNAQLRISTVTGAVGSEVYTPGTATPTLSSPWADTVPGDFLPQAGTTSLINQGDASMQYTIYRNGSLWCTQHVFLPAASPNRTSVQWLQMAPDGTIQQFARIDDPTATFSYAIPSIAVNKNSDVLIGYNRFSTTQFVSADYAFRGNADAPNTLRQDTILKAGEAKYFKTIPPDTSNRWGDFSETVVDPVNDTDFWTIQEYAATPSGGTDMWGTWWGQIVPPAVQPPTITSASSVNAPLNQPFSYTITATNNPTSFGISGTIPPGLVTSNGNTISGTPTTAGVFTLTISATNAGGTTSETLTLNLGQSTSLAITSGPTATPNPAAVNQAIQFSVVASFTDVTHSWDFGDGSPPDTSASPSHSYSVAGAYTVTVTINRAVTNETVSGSVTVSVGGFNGNPAGTPVNVASSRHRFTFNFRIPFRDSLDITFSSFNTFAYNSTAKFDNEISGKSIDILIGTTKIDTVTMFGTAGVGAGSTIKWDIRHGNVRYRIHNVNLANLFAPFGAVNDNVSESVSIPIFMRINGVLVGNVYTFFYRAHFNRGGTGR